MPGPGCGNKKPNWLEKMVRLQTETDVVGDGEWDTESDLVTQVGEPVASAVQFTDAIDAIIHYGQAKDGDIISVSSEPTEPSSLEITFSDADISSTESGVKWDVVDTMGVPEQTASNSSESGEFYNCYKVDGSVSSPLYRLPDGKSSRLFLNMSSTQAMHRPQSLSLCQISPPLFRISHQQLEGM